MIVSFEFSAFTVLLWRSVHTKYCYFSWCICLFLYSWACIYNDLIITNCQGREYRKGFCDKVVFTYLSTSSTCSINKVYCTKFIHNILDLGSHLTNYLVIFQLAAARFSQFDVFLLLQFTTCSMNGHIKQTAPGLVRSRKLSCFEPGQ